MKKHIAQQYEIRWPESEDFKLEAPKELDEAIKPKESTEESQPELWPERLK